MTLTQTSTNFKIEDTFKGKQVSGSYQKGDYSSISINCENMNYSWNKYDNVNVNYNCSDEDEDDFVTYAKNLVKEVLNK